ncbi:hypothetical protein BH11VER1_BH11VER1_06230 [soil metagenome]
MKRAPLPFLRHSILACCGVATLTACGPGDKPQVESGSSDKPPSSNSADSKPAAAAPDKKSPSVVNIESKLIDLRTIELPEGTATPGQRTLANLIYNTKGDTKSVFEFHRKQFLDLGWKEAAGSSITGASASGMFSGAGYHISVAAYPVGTPGSVDVMLQNHGNFDLSKLPLPPGTKKIYSGPVTVMQATEAPVAETIEACKKLLADAGWEWHGSTNDTFYVKKGTNRVTVMISSAAGQDGKTMITYSGELMSADLPVPPDALGVQYVDTLRRITFETAGASEAVFTYYKPVLAKTGWKPNREESYNIDDKDEMVFRNGDGVLFLEVKKEHQGKRQVMLSYTTVAEMDAQAQREKAAAMKMLAAKKAEEEKPKPQLSIAIPAGASKIEKTKNSLKFTIGNGKAKAAAEGLRKQFSGDGWKEGAGSLEGMAGMLSFSKEQQSISVSYMDTGFTPAEVSLMVTGIELDATGGEK